MVRKETISLASDAHTIIEIILISCCQDEIVIAFFLRANAVVELSPRGALASWTRERGSGWRAVFDRFSAGNVWHFLVEFFHAVPIALLAPVKRADIH
jgi:hypothetical protein